MEPRNPKPEYGDLAHIGQVVFAADGRARALVWQGQRYPIAGDPATQLEIGRVARQANLYINPATLELFDQQHRRLGQAERRDG
jgi:hypothetical protein